jgi:anti-sigma regulatory factor (Ser/Thr protein kinase)
MAHVHMPTHLVDTVIPATPVAPSEARAAIASIGHELPQGLVSDAALLVSELVTNSVRHAGGAPASRVRVRALASSDGLRVEVHDWGTGFSLDTDPTPSWRKGAGFGLYLVRRLAARWGIERGETMRVWFELDTEPGR